MDAQIDGFNGEEYMKMQDEQLRELFQQKLSGHESPVNPSLWNNIQSGIGGQSAGAVTTAAKTGFLKIASIVSGIVVTGGIIGYIAFSEPVGTEEVVAQKTEISTQNDTPTTATQTEVALPETSTESKVETPTSIYSPEKEFSPPVFMDDPNENVLESSPESSDKKASMPYPNPNSPAPDEKGKTDSKPIQESNNEDFTTDFNVVGTSDMGLMKMLIPTFTKASSYRWTIDHGDAVYSEMSTTHDFTTPGDHHILLEIEKTPSSGFTEYSEKTICVCPAAEIRIDYDLFTPNGDYYSRIFDPLIQSRNIIPTRLLIFEKSTRKLVFEGANENAKWDGTGPFGQEFPSGQYFYQFSATDLCGKKLVDKTGFIELQR